MKVLIVDDSFTVRQYFKEIFQGFGWEVEEAVNGLEALEKVLNGEFDLMTVDVNMPKMDGYTCVYKVREMGISLPVILISTESKEQDKLKGLQAGATLYLVKPVLPEQIKSYAMLLTGS
ncbi:response regulator [Carboxydothermus islandicus]|uniref:Stage 0 sporulation protein A homolog n=1 Tax=Carboxydothermus islandicus TaxID=661089 RepID=A0A1L8D4W5_9THEO|nr:response regulator [Carboxydothermus islandicus]GAV26198.1 response regulator [Carboxydothermus islandicus]